jgi:A/G-specific adenine glycosylase
LIISNIIKDWYLVHYRNLPWRKTNDPYIIWISEVVLQQTRVIQGEKYFLAFIEKFPDVEHLAKANIDEVLKLWQGLGYYSRARNLHKAAQFVVEELNGKFPSSYQEIMKLKGVGIYTASAIASFAFNEPIPLVDGNVSRVISRLFGIIEPIDTGAGKKKILEAASEILNINAPAQHNQAMMEFGALQCVPKSPNCAVCPLNHACYAFENNMAGILPIKSKKTKQRDRFFQYLYIVEKGKTFIRKREKSDIWKSLYELPLIETLSMTEPEDLFVLDEWNNLIGNQEILIESISDTIIHQLTHQRIHTKFYHVKIQNSTDYLNRIYKSVSPAELEEYAVPKLIENYLRSEAYRL